MEATDRLLDTIQDNKCYEAFVTNLLMWLEGKASRPSYVSMNDTAMEDIMTRIVEICAGMKERDMA